MQSTFTWFDYVLFIFTLILSALIGIYYGFVKKQNTAADYLLGGKQMSVFPIATSIISSSLSGLFLISFPADLYKYGITFSITLPLMVFVMLTAYYVTVPVFYKLEVTSVYEYLVERFDNNVRMFASVLYTIHQVFFIPIIIYVPALALAQATGVSVHYITPVVCSICIFYTTLGGMKGIVLTDAIQFGIMLGTLLMVAIFGLWSFGGFGSVFETAYIGRRLDVSFELTMFKRDTFWSGLCLFLAMTHHYCVNQSFVQKCLSLPSYKHIKHTMILVTIGTLIVKACLLFSGLLIFAKYFDCDPLKMKVIDKYDQLMPVYVMENVNFIPGFSGLFLSGIFTTSLSTLSASMNGLAATLYQDFFARFVPKDTTQERISLYLKCLVVFIGIFATASVFIVEKLGSLLALTFSLGSVTGGPLLGLFFVGMLIPKVNSKGALYGGIASLLFMSWLILTTQWYKFQGILRDPILPVSTDGCNATITSTFNETISNVVIHGAGQGEPLRIFRMSFYFYSITGVLIVTIVGLIVSLFTKDIKPLNEDCISPVIHSLLNKRGNSEYNTVEKAKELVNKN